MEFFQAHVLLCCVLVTVGSVAISQPCLLHGFSLVYVLKAATYSPDNVQHFCKHDYCLSDAPAHGVVVPADVHHCSKLLQQHITLFTPQYTLTLHAMFLEMYNVHLCCSRPQRDGSSWFGKACKGLAVGGALAGAALLASLSRRR